MSSPPPAIHTCPDWLSPGRNLFFLPLIFALFVANLAIARDKVVLAASEHEPYIGMPLPDQGYVHELVTRAFERVY